MIINKLKLRIWWYIYFGVQFLLEIFRKIKIIAKHQTIIEIKDIISNTIRTAAPKYSPANILQYESLMSSFKLLL